MEVGSRANAARRWLTARLALVLALAVGALTFRVLLTPTPLPSAKTVPPDPDPLRMSLASASMRNTSALPPPTSRVIWLDDTTRVVETTEFFPQQGTNALGQHFRLENPALLDDLMLHDREAVLLVMTLHDGTSYGRGRSSDDLFKLLAQFSFPTRQISMTVLVSDRAEFAILQQQMRIRIRHYARFSLLFRNDFNARSSVTRKNRHDSHLQGARRRMLARYRNYALLSTLEPWHDHVLWLDADVHIIPPDLLTKMVDAKRDILEPLCFAGHPPSQREYDLNAWLGTRKRPSGSDRRGFKPGPADVLRIKDFRGGPNDFIPLDSVGGTMLYVRADVHRQGVLFTHHYVIGSAWDREGFDGIETEGLCYSAAYLGFQCWGMPNDAIYHVLNW